MEWLIDLWGLWVGLAFLGALHYSLADWKVSPDGQRYLAAGKGRRVQRPFYLRWLLPVFLKDNTTAWQVSTSFGIAVGTIAVAFYARGLGLDWAHAGFAALLFAGLPMQRTNVFLPVLVDAPALALTAVSAALVVNGYVIAGVLVAVLGATVKEHVPIFAAAATLNPWLLLALVAPAIRALAAKPAPSDHEGQAFPFRFAWASHSKHLLSAMVMLLPWGICLAALWAPTPAVWVSLAASYGMLLVAGDTVRIYQWGCLPLCVAAAAVLPEGWLVPAAAAHLLNPFQGEV